jgi:hypothetical protein
MKKGKLYLVVIVLLISCGYRNPHTSLNIEDSISRISNGKLNIDNNSLYIDTIYIVDDELYLEVPQLPGGFFLYYNFKQEYPILSHVKSRRGDNNWKGDIFNIECIYFYEDTFIIQGNNVYYKVVYNTGSYVTVNDLEYGIKKTYIFTPVQTSSGWIFTGGGLFCFFSGNRINGYKIFLDGIYKFEIGLIGDNSTFHVWGESVYGFFDINMDTLEITFPKDLSLYKNQFTIYNIIVSKDYDPQIYNNIGNRRRIKIFEEIIYDLQ